MTSDRVLCSTSSCGRVSSSVRVSRCVCTARSGTPRYTVLGQRYVLHNMRTANTHLIRDFSLLELFVIPDLLILLEPPYRLADKTDIIIATKKWVKKSCFLSGFIKLLFSRLYLWQEQRFDWNKTNKTWQKVIFVFIYLCLRRVCITIFWNSPERFLMMAEGLNKLVRSCMAEEHIL